MGILLSRQPAQITAQTTGALTFTGTLYTTSAQPVAPGTSIIAIAATTNTTCGQGVTGSGGNYTIPISASASCTTPGTVLVFKVGNIPATPTTFVTSATGSVTLNLTVALAATTSTSGSTTGNVLTPPSSPPAGASTTTTAAGVLTPPATPAGDATPQPSASAVTSTAATQTQPHTVTEPLTMGCNLIVVTFGANAQPQQVVSAALNPAAVVSVWHFDNASQHYSAYFPNPAAPSDLKALAPVDAIFVCVTSDTSLNAPQP